MKRLNPKTGLPFKLGDLREDGYAFKTYLKKKIVNGYFDEHWISQNALQKELSTKHNWQKQNPVQARQAKQKWQKQNPDKVTAKVVKRYSAKLKRTPSWANLNLISVWYTRAKLATIFMDEKYQVDHIIPLQGKTVSGFHVESNLQILSASENILKSNTWVTV